MNFCIEERYDWYGEIYHDTYSYISRILHDLQRAIEADKQGLTIAQLQQKELLEELTKPE